jgi:alkylation response protein AidB-like acyl-CoA dehydrogenase
LSAHNAPSPEQLVRTAADLVPLVRSKAAWSDEHRRLHEDVVDALAGSGLLNLRRPVRYGGYETNTRTVVDVVATLAGGDGSFAWNTSTWLIGSWMAGMFADHVQDEVFSTPSVRVCAVLSPTATATPADGGLVVNGEWHFMSGAHHSQWQVVITMAPAPDGTGLWPVMALVPLSDLEVVDDWHTNAMVGTGSVTTVARDLFVPLDRTIPMVSVLQDNYLSAANADSAVFTQPMVLTGASGFSGVAIGLARAAREEFFTRLPQRKITYTSYEKQSDAPLTHLQVAAATLRLDEAEFHAYRLADWLDDKAVAREQWKMEDRTRYRGIFGRMVQLATESVDILATASGASSLYRTVSMRRIQNDLQALSLHALMHPDTNAELYGRVLCGLEPNTLYL